MISMKINTRLNGTRQANCWSLQGICAGEKCICGWAKSEFVLMKGLARLWALRVKDAIKIARSQKDSDLGSTLIVAKAIDSANDGLEVLPHCWPKFGFSHVIQTGQPFKPMVIGLALVDAKLVLNGIKPTENFCLHDKYCFEHSLCVVFSHAAFLQLVDGVATNTLAGFGVAFYKWEAV